MSNHQLCSSDICTVKGCGCAALSDGEMCFEHQAAWAKQNRRPDWMPGVPEVEDVGDW